MAAAGLSPHPKARASKRRVPLGLSGSPASPWGGSVRVRRRREEAIDIVRSADRFGFGPAITFELSPDATECEGRPVLVERKPDDVFLFGVGVRLRRIFGEAVRRNQASTFRLQPAASEAM